MSIMLPLGRVSSISIMLTLGCLRTSIPTWHITYLCKWSPFSLSLCLCSSFDIPRGTSLSRELSQSKQTTRHDATVHNALSNLDASECASCCRSASRIQMLEKDLVETAKRSKTLEEDLVQMGKNFVREVFVLECLKIGTQRNSSCTMILFVYVRETVIRKRVCVR